MLWREAEKLPVARICPRGTAIGLEGWPGTEPPGVNGGERAALVLAREEVAGCQLVR